MDIFRHIESQSPNSFISTKQVMFMLQDTARLVRAVLFLPLLRVKECKLEDF